MARYRVKLYFDSSYEDECEASSSEEARELVIEKCGNYHLEEVIGAIEVEEIEED